MAVNPYDKAHELAKAITNSEQYLNYVNVKGLIEGNEELTGKLLQLRNLQMRLNVAEELDEEARQELINQINGEFTTLNQIEEVREFFQAENQFVLMFNDIQQIIQKKIEEGFK